MEVSLWVVTESDSYNLHRFQAASILTIPSDRNCKQCFVCTPCLDKPQACWTFERDPFRNQSHHFWVCIPWLAKCRCQSGSPKGQRPVNWFIQIISSSSSSSSLLLRSQSRLFDTSHCFGTVDMYHCFPLSKFSGLGQSFSLAEHASYF